MDGIFVNYNRPKTKKAIKDAIAANPATVSIDSTSMFGGYGGPVSDAPDGSYPFVGPDPYTKRSFYGTITKKGDKITVK